MNYPLGPFPPEIIANIAQQDREVFRILSMTSRRLYLATRPALREIGESSISTSEIRHHFSQLPVGDIVGVDHKRLRSFQIQIQKMEIDKFLIIVRNDLFDSNLDDVVSYLLEECQLGLVTIYQIYQSRRSCVKVEPDYALRKTWEFVTERNREEFLTLCRSNNIFSYPPW